MTRAARAVPGLLVALVGLALLLAAVVVGAVPAAAGNGVVASTPVMINTVWSSTDIGAGQPLGKTVPQPSFVVATGVATEGVDGAADVALGVRLRAELTAEQISGGHAFADHVVKAGESSGITTRQEFASHIVDVVANGESRELLRGSCGLLEERHSRDPRSGEG